MPLSNTATAATTVDELRDAWSGKDRAQNYHFARPSYAAAAFEHIRTLLADRPNPKVHELGCGTGLATKDLAAMNIELTASDPSVEMLGWAKINCGENAHKVTFLNEYFENHGLENTDGNSRQVSDQIRYDAIVAAHALHWLPKEVQFSHPRALLKDGGYLIELFNQIGSTVPFLQDEFEIYQSVFPDPSRVYQSPEEQFTESVQTHLAEIDSSGLFKAEFASFENTMTFTAERYVGWVDSFSSSSTMDPSAKSKLFQAFTETINNKYNGAIEMPFRTMLFASKKTP